MTLQVRERDFDKVGGLKDHIRTLKEMIIYPLLYRELFDTYGIEAPRGVLFHGPPGTGKTLVAGAVAAECSKSGGRRVSFYVRKGADCLNKYVGESEKHLQNLFNQAQSTRPSIIFFDEIDGLVPTRSEAQEQVHASVVSTLLALMDGLDTKSEVFVIGATNRIDMIDPALRRPGRFDRELYFPLPPLESRIQIFHIHTRHWKQRPSTNLILKLASECAGFCGADVQALCSQAVMESFHRHFPQVSDTSKRQHVNCRSIEVQDEDFWRAKEKLIPASQRIYILPSKPLTPELEPLLRRSLDECLDHISHTCPFRFLYHNRQDFSKNKSFTCPRVLLMGREGQGHVSHIAPAILHHFDHLPVTVVDLSSINDQNLRNSEASSLLQKIREARQSMPGILYFPDITSWWESIEETARMVLVASIDKLDASNNSQLFILATVNSSNYENLPVSIQNMFPKKKAFSVFGPIKEERFNFFAQLIIEKSLTPPQPKPEQHLGEEYEHDADSLHRKRRSRRQQGLEVEYLGIDYDRKPKLGSYFRKYIKETPYLKNPKFEDPKSKSLFPTYPANPPKIKRMKTETWEVQGSPKGPTSLKELCDAMNLQVDRLEELVHLAVRETHKCPVNTIVKLYEELEIISLRYESQWDRTRVPEEMEREISLVKSS